MPITPQEPYPCASVRLVSEPVPNVRCHSTTILYTRVSVTYIRFFHHSEVISSHNIKFHSITQKLRPTIITKIGSVVQQPLHRSRILFLSWWRSWVIRVGADSISAPDRSCKWCFAIGEWLGLVVGQHLDGGGEMREEPARCTTRLACA